MALPASREINWARHECRQQAITTGWIVSRHIPAALKDQRCNSSTMSRKANISALEKAAFGRPRLYAVRAHYGPLDKQPDQFSGAVVVLDDEGEGVVRHAAAAQALCFDEDTTVVVLDVAALRRDVDAAAERTRDKKTRGRGKRGWSAALEAEAKTRDVLGKDCGRPIAKALARLLMRAPTGATLVARGNLAAVALKLALTRDAHAATCNVSRVVLVEPTLSAVAVNGILACKTPPARRITVDAAFADDDARMRRGPAIAAACGEGISVIAPDDGGDAVLRAFLPRTDDEALEAAVAAAFGAEDSRGRRLRCAEVTVDMSPLTKQPEQRFDDVLPAELLAAARGDDEADEPAAACDADDKGEARVAALVVRGGRCILARSLHTPKAWEGMRLPSAPAVAGEDAISGARRAIAAQLDIDIADQADQMAPIPNLPPLMLYRASGGISTVVFMKALQPPVEPQEDYDLSDDEEDDYDWYTLSRALPRVDAPTASLLRTAAFALRGAVEAGVVAKEWGGVFGDELVATVAGGTFGGGWRRGEEWGDALAATPAQSSPVRVVGPCHDEANHEDACSCASDPFSC